MPKRKKKRENSRWNLWEGNYFTHEYWERHTVPILECNTQVFKGFTGAFCMDKGCKTAE